jgi:hypothetical protein
MIRFFRVTVFSGKLRHHGVPEESLVRTTGLAESEIALMETEGGLADFEIRFR